jgi:hypothetical protein
MTYIKTTSLSLCSPWHRHNRASSAGCHARCGYIMQGGSRPHATQNATSLCMRPYHAHLRARNCTCHSCVMCPATQEMEHAFETQEQNKTNQTCLPQPTCSPFIPLSFSADDTTTVYRHPTVILAGRAPYRTLTHVCTLCLPCLFDGKHLPGRRQFCLRRLRSRMAAACRHYG